jgi:pentatricopeptide repeat protein
MNLSDSPRRPACPSRVSGWSSLTTSWGLPCRVRFPCVHAVATTPAQRLGLVFARSSQPYQPSPLGLSGRPVHRPFRGLLSVHSRYGLHTRAVTVYRDMLSEGFGYLVTSIAAPAASGWSDYRVGFAPTGKRRILTAHTPS